MLGKLIKHEFKSVNRLMLPLHLGLIVITIIGRFYVQFVMAREHVNYANSSLRVWEGIMDFMLISVYVIALIAIFVITWLYLNILHFRKNLFTDEGYLMHTLPATATEHIISKLSVTALWKFVDGILIALSIFVMMVNKNIWQDVLEFWGEMWHSFPDVFGVPAAIGLPVLLAIALLDLISDILIIYMCITIGHSFNSYRIISSIGIYAGYCILLNLITSVFTALTGIGTFGASNIFFGIGNYYSHLDTDTYFWLNMGFAGILSLVTGASAFVLTNYFMSRRLNLE